MRRRPVSRAPGRDAKRKGALMLKELALWDRSGTEFAAIVRAWLVVCSPPMPRTCPTRSRRKITVMKHDSTPARGGAWRLAAFLFSMALGLVMLAIVMSPGHAMAQAATPTPPGVITGTATPAMTATAAVSATATTAVTATATSAVTATVAVSPTAVMTATSVPVATATTAPAATVAPMATATTAAPPTLPQTGAGSDGSTPFVLLALGLIAFGAIGLGMTFTKARGYRR
jgi:hypothetical protein